MTELLTVAEVAKLLRISEWTVGAMTRDGRLPRVRGIRSVRIPRDAVERLAAGGYDDADGEPDREAQAEAAPPRRGNRRPSPGSLAREAVGSGGAVPRRVGPSTGDVVIRRVEG